MDKKDYKNYSWLFNEAITLGKTENQIAAENGWTVRVIRKWIQKYGLGDNNFKSLKRLNNYQTQLIKGSILGDGHITEQGIFIISHCKMQKDYLYWKYEILKDCCKRPPKEYPGKTKTIQGKICNAQTSYRLNTRKINFLKTLRNIDKIILINNLSDFELSIWLLDDGYRDVYTWDLCVASLNNEERNALENILQKRGLNFKYRKDSRYIGFNNESTKKLDDLILNNIPNKLDIIQNKIIKKQRGGDADNGQERIS